MGAEMHIQFSSDSRIQTLEGWRGESIDQVLWLCRETLDDSSWPTVKAWREGGGKVLGHFQVYFPEEFAHAAGMLPVKMAGATVEPRLSDGRFGSYLCSIMKTNLEQALSGRLVLDMFVTHPICDAARNLGAIWGRNFDYPCQILYLPQNPNSAYSKQYLTDEYSRLRGEIEKVSGREITDDALRNSIAVFNENRMLLRRLYDIKRELPWVITADEAYTLIRLAGFMPREEHNELLSYVLSLLPSRPSRKQDRIRVVFEGGFCEQPPLDLLRTIGQSCYVVDDDLLIGLRWITEDVESGEDPVAALASAYIDQSSYSPVQHDLNKPKERMLLERVREAEADAVIVTAAKMCEPGLEEQVNYIHMLEAEGIPFFVSEFEENMTTFDHLEIQLETFVENILFD
ncbi:MAG TPA: 2-hydroxyacyl-CoA dehydratase [Candidatus Thalassarchaeaceae archaeon]|nr:2-hydroxyacyl-CoA dehydratase [Candidatus Thalassarchaeaceae archaeon]